MKLVKYEKPDCPACELVEEFLKKSGVSYEKRDAFSHPEEMRKIRAMTVPVVVVYDEEGNVVAKSVGYKENELTELVNMLNHH